MLGAAAGGPEMAGAEGRRGRPRGAGFALSVWRQAWAWALVWEQAGACGVGAG